MARRGDGIYAARRRTIPRTGTFQSPSGHDRVTIRADCQSNRRLRS